MKKTLKKLELGKVNITKLNNLNKIKGGGSIDGTTYRPITVDRLCGTLLCPPDDKA